MFAPAAANFEVLWDAPGQMPKARCKLHMAAGGDGGGGAGSDRNIAADSRLAITNVSSIPAKVPAENVDDSECSLPKGNLGRRGAICRCRSFRVPPRVRF